MKAYDSTDQQPLAGKKGPPLNSQISTSKDSTQSAVNQIWNLSAQNRKKDQNGRHSIYLNSEQQGD